MSESGSTSSYKRYNYFQAPRKRRSPGPNPQAWKYSVGMGQRELLHRQTAVEVLAEAQAAAVAGIGLRGREAQRRMHDARMETRARIRDERWLAILRGAVKTRFARVKAGEGRAWRGGDEPVDQG